jgi:hypothetical protein
MLALDFQVDTTVDGRQVRFLHIVDEFTSEALATQAFRSCSTNQLIEVLKRGTPRVIGTRAIPVVGNCCTRASNRQQGPAPRSAMEHLAGEEFVGIENGAQSCLL